MHWISSKRSKLLNQTRIKLTTFWPKPKMIASNYKRKCLIYSKNSKSFGPTWTNSRNELLSYNKNHSLLKIKAKLRRNLSNVSPKRALFTYFSISKSRIATLKYMASQSAKNLNSWKLIGSKPMQASATYSLRIIIWY